MNLLRIKSFFVAVGISCLLPMSVGAVKADAVNGEKVLIAEQADDLGSITIKLSDTENKASKENVKFQIIKVADVLNGQFVMDEEYKNTEIDLNDIKTADDLENAAEKLVDVNCQKEQVNIVTDENGKAETGKLETGAYLVYAIDIADYDEITPSIVSIPLWDEKESNMIYDITIEPKHTPLPNLEQDKDKVNYSVASIQTGLPNRYIGYGIMSGVCLILAVIIWGYHKKWKKSLLEENG